MGPPYTIKDVRSFPRTMGCGDTVLELSRHDTTTKFFLSAAAHVLVLSKINNGPIQHARSAQLLSENTSDAQLKQNAKELWFETLASGANKIAAGYPDSWWYRD